MPESELYQTGTEPEFFITRIAKIEIVSGGSLRIYCASEREATHRLEYTVIVPVELMAPMMVQMMHALANCERLRAGVCPLLQ